MSSYVFEVLKFERMGIVDVATWLVFVVFVKILNFESFGQFSVAKVIYGPHGSYFLIKSPYMDRMDHIFLEESPYMDCRSVHFWEKTLCMDRQSVHFWKEVHIISRPSVSPCLEEVNLYGPSVSLYNLCATVTLFIQSIYGRSPFIWTVSQSVHFYGIGDWDWVLGI